MSNDTDKQYLYIKHPSTEEKGRFYLIVTKPSSGLFGSGGQIIYSVDSVEVKNRTVFGYVGEGVLVAQFPDRLDYLVVPRDRAEFLGPEEAAERQVTLEKRFGDSFNKHFGTGNPPSEMTVPVYPQESASPRGFSYI